jgi:hypothetical protein
VGSTRQILRSAPPRMGYSYGELRSLPRNEFRLGGFVRDTENTREHALALALASSRR